MSDTEFSASRLIGTEDIELGGNYQPPKSYIWRWRSGSCAWSQPPGRVSIIGETHNEKWKEHVQVMVNRFQNSNLTAGLILTTTAVLLSSSPPLPHPVDYTTLASYTVTLIASGAASLSVIFGTAIYEAGVSYKDMNMLKDLSRWRIIYLLLWLGVPYICLVIAIVCLLLSVMVACFRVENTMFMVITALGFLILFVNTILSLYILTFVGKKSASDLELQRKPQDQT